MGLAGEIAKQNVEDANLFPGAYNILEKDELLKELLN